MELSKVVEKYNEANRPKSLMEEYQQKYMHARAERDDPSKRKFDRDRDLGFRRYDDNKREAFISKSLRLFFIFFSFPSFSFIFFFPA